MKRSAVLRMVLLGMVAGSPVGAQQTGQSYRVGILTGRTPDFDRPFLAAFRRKLDGLGYQETTNLEIVYLTSGGASSRLPSMAAEIVGANAAHLTMTPTCCRTCHEIKRQLS